MLTFEQKLRILDSYPELTRRDVSLGRVNYSLETSLHDKKTVAYHLHPNGNGYVYAGLLRGRETDAKGLVNIREFEEAELRELVEASIASLSQAPADAGTSAPRKPKKAKNNSVWLDADGSVLELKAEEGLWYLYSGPNLDMAFETRAEAEEYLAEEGFTEKPE
ncbi:hypothetical protein F4V43_10385 [Paenibacillus spiritus]|uniref:Uncharacterized protein n=1 Tax=Paenibacillus spiritus TaxID=2496557 RepID=A0A5J5GA91_9BACL|nr:hypothetical protein [Paenibacillus spiritus]KAA9004722.1 hypothetical protein F4V43_10385 [Paenibacillus spiritus]